MKKRKLLAIAIASLGTIGSMSAAFALYQSGFGVEQGVGFGGINYTPSGGSYKYLSSLVAAGNEGFAVESGNAALSPTNTTVTYSFKIAAGYATASPGLVKQDAIIGKLSIAKSGSLASNISISAYVDGYESRKVEQVEQNYWAKADSLAARTLSADGENTISAHIPAPTSIAADMATAVTNNKYLTVHVTVTLNDLTATDFVNLDEGQYALNVTYTDPDNTFGRPYVVGDGTGWTVEDEYGMVPNLGAGTYEWCYKDLNSDANHTFSAMKVLLNINGKDTADIWNPEKWTPFGSKADISANITCDPATTYFVTYKGSDRGGFNVDGTNIYQD